ncbi:hypothetical protein [Dongia sedimenti]|uniref:2-phospho-L-lactate transferase n=1 Tax=Dongia sedimenti TaxID=3064282 RepID=A0ABU0YVD2_9PROT|nr:hypothetical protein [Rhodospirillaceae bacterium R-7]
MRKSLMIIGAGPGIGKAVPRNIVQALVEPLAERHIRIAIATVSTLVGPGSTLATSPDPQWEAVYPAPAST